MSLVFSITNQPIRATGQTHTFSFDDLFIRLIAYLQMLYVNFLNTNKRLINKKWIDYY